MRTTATSPSNLLSRSKSSSSSSLSLLRWSWRDHKGCYCRNDLVVDIKFPTWNQSVVLSTYSSSFGRWQHHQQQKQRLFSLRSNTTATITNNTLNTYHNHRYIVKYHRRKVQRYGLSTTTTTTTTTTTFTSNSIDSDSDCSIGNSITNRDSDVGTSNPISLTQQHSPLEHQTQQHSPLEHQHPPLQTPEQLSNNIAITETEIPTGDITTITTLDVDSETVTVPMELSSPSSSSPRFDTLNENKEAVDHHSDIIVMTDGADHISTSLVETHSNSQSPEVVSSLSAHDDDETREGLEHHTNEIANITNTDNAIVSSFQVHDDDETKKEDLVHPLDCITTTTNATDTDNVICAEPTIMHTTSSFISTPAESVQLPNDIHTSSISNDEITDDGTDKNRGMTLTAFMAGERPTATLTNDIATKTSATTSNVKPRANNPRTYKSHGKPVLSSNSSVNGFIPKSSTRPPATMKYSGNVPVDDNFDNSHSTRNHNVKKRPTDMKKDAIKQMLSNVGKQLLNYTKMPPRIPNPLLVLGDHLIAQGETLLPKSTWVHVEGISPVSSLDALLDGIQHALDIEAANGIVDLDARWNEAEPIPFLTLSSSEDPTPTVDIRSSSGRTSHENSIVKPHKWVQKAKLIISPFARPTGWYLQFANRSIVYSLLRHAQEHPIRSAWRQVRIKEYKNRMVTDNSETNQMDYDVLHPISYGNFLLNDDISDATLRVENCPVNVTEASMLNFFSRYDLKSAVDIHGNKAIQRWSGTTEDGKVCPPTTYLVHFADASWARAALREKQGTYMSKMGQLVINHKNPKPLHLVQYPKQII